MSATLPWWQGQGVDGDHLIASINSARKLTEGNEQWRLEAPQKTLPKFALVANKLEGVLPANYEDPTATQLLDLQAARGLVLPVKFSSAPAQTWPAEGGGSSKETKQQLLQFMKATQYLCGSKAGNGLRAPLTVEDIQTAHQLLMWGAVEKNGVPVQAGQFRTEAAHSSTGTVFAKPEEVLPKLQQILDDYNAQAAQGVPVHVLVSELLYKVVVVHPFTNGNGRLVRILAAYAALAAGEPFFLYLHDGRTDARKHYLQAIRRADRTNRNSKSWLELFVLDCLNSQWKLAIAQMYLGKKLDGSS